MYKQYLIRDLSRCYSATEGGKTRVIQVYARGHMTVSPNWDTGCNHQKSCPIPFQSQPRRRAPLQYGTTTTRGQYPSSPSSRRNKSQKDRSKSLTDPHPHSAGSTSATVNNISTLGAGGASRARRRLWMRGEGGRVEPNPKLSHGKPSHPSG